MANGVAIMPRVQRAKPEVLSFALSRMKTPIGAALVVTDDEGCCACSNGKTTRTACRPARPVLRRRPRAARRRHRGKISQAGARPVEGLFRRRHRRDRGHRRRRAPAPSFSASAGRCCARSRPARPGAIAGLPGGSVSPKRCVRWVCQRRQPDQCRRSLPSRDRRQRLADRLWRRPRPQALAAAPRRRPSGRLGAWARLSRPAAVGLRPAAGWDRSRPRWARCLPDRAARPGDLRIVQRAGADEDQSRPRFRRR